MPRITVQVSDKAYDGLRDSARAHGHTVAALVTAFGEAVDDAASVGRNPTWLRRLFDQARTIRFDRLERRQGD